VALAGVHGGDVLAERPGPARLSPRTRGLWKQFLKAWRWVVKNFSGLMSTYTMYAKTSRAMKKRRSMGESDFFKNINGFEAEVETDQPEGENSDSKKHG
jgi:hypothetical protein